MKKSIVEYQQFAQSPAPRTLGPFLTARLYWKAWLGLAIILVVCLLMVLKVLTADRMIDQLRLDLTATKLAKGHIYRTWDLSKPDFIEVEGDLRGYGFVYLIDGNADNEGFCFAYAKPHEVGDNVQVEYLKADPSISVISGYFLNPYLPDYWFRFVQVGLLCLTAGYFENKRRRWARFLETGETTQGTIVDIKRVGWRTWQVSVTFTHSNNEHTIRSTVIWSSEDHIRAVEEAFGLLTVVVHPKKPKKSVVIEFLGI